MNQVKPNKSHNRGRQAKTRRGQVPLWMFPVLAVLIIAAVLMTNNYLTDQTQVTLKEPTYQYFLDYRVDFSSNAVLMDSKSGTVIRTEDDQQDGDPSPLYFAERKALVLPQRMSWMDPERSLEWQIPAYSEIRLDNQGNVWCTHNKDTFLLPGGFLSDCKGTTVFLDRTDLNLNGKVYNVSPLSFYSTLAGVYRVYSYDEARLYQADQLYFNTEIHTARGYSADLTSGIYTNAVGNKRLLSASPDILMDISKR